MKLESIGHMLRSVTFRICKGRACLLTSLAVALSLTIVGCEGAESRVQWRTPYFRGRVLSDQHSLGAASIQLYTSGAIGDSMSPFVPPLAALPVTKHPSGQSENSPAGQSADQSAPNVVSPTTGAVQAGTQGGAKLAFLNSPENTSAGALLRPTIRVGIVGASGNLLSSGTNQVSLSVSAGGKQSPLAGDLVSPSVSGVANFLDVQFGHAGTGYVLTASSPGLTSATVTGV